MDLKYTLMIIKDALECMVEEVYVEEVLSTVVQSLKDLFKATSCGILTWEDRIRVKISRGWSYTYIKKLHNIQSHPLIEEMKKEKKLIIIDENHPLYPTGFEHSYKLLILIPLFSKKEIIGMIFVNLEDKRELSEEEVTLFTITGYIVSVALDYYKLQDRLSEINNIDTLTGVFNYKHFHELLYREVVRTNETGHPFSLALISITGIKEFNEHFGHVKGDELLKSVASFLRENIRRFDILARYGGAKFVIIFPEATKEEAIKFLKIILEKFEETPWAKTNPRVYLDIGLVSYPEDATDEKLLLNRLEECVHEAKRRKGHNIISWPIK